MTVDSIALFEILVREHSAMLTMYLKAAGCDDNLVDEVWQESMVVAWRKLDTFDRKLPFGPWLRGIAARTLLSRARSLHRIKLIGDHNELAYLSDRLEQVAQLRGDTLDDKLDALRDCIGLLPQADRECIELRFREELKPAAISEKIGVSLETAKKRLLRAKARLKKCIEGKLAAMPSLDSPPTASSPS